MLPSCETLMTSVEKAQSIRMWLLETIRDTLISSYSCLLKVIISSYVTQEFREKNIS